MSNALRTTVLVTALALSPQVSGALGDVPAVPPAVPQAPTQCGESQTRIVSLLDGEVGCKDMLPSSKLEVRVAQGDLSTNAFNDPISIGGEWQERQRTQNAEKAQSIRAAQEKLFAQMDGKPLSAPPQLTLRDGNTTFSGQVVTGKNSGTGGRADLLVDEGEVAVGASVTMTPYMRSVFGSLGFKIMDNLNGTITFSTTNVDAARALANTEYKGDLQAWSASGSLHWGAAFVRFLHEQGKSRDESNPLATRMTVSSTVSTEEFATFLRTTTTTIKGKTVTLWDAFIRQTLTAGYTVDIGDQTQVKVFTGATRDTNNGTNLVGGVDITYYGGDYRLDGGVHKFTETWGASIGAEYALTGTTSIFFRGNYNPQHGIAPSNVSTIVGIRVSFDGSSNPGRTFRFTIPKAGSQNVAQLVEETLRDPRLQVDPVKLGKIRNIVTETIEKAIDDIQKLPEAVQGARAVVNADNSVTVTFSPRNGWGYESRIDTGTWTPVLGAGFTTAVLPAGVHTIALREKHPTTNVSGHITSLSVNITAPNQNPNPFSAIAPISVTVGTAGSTTLPTTTDPNGDTLTYSTVGTLPTGFSFNPTTRVLSWIAGTTAGTYSLNYKADDGKGGSVTSTISLNVSAAPNTPPTAINFTAGALTAGALTAGQSVGNLTCTDLESATCTYVLSSQSTPGAFAVAANGAVTVANTALTAATYTVTVVATDAGGLTRTETKNIVVSAAPNTPPTAINFTAGALTAGALTAGQSVGNLTCTDLESATCTYVLSSQSTPGAFAVAANGAVTVANTALTAATYTVTVVATDAGGLTRTETKNIVVSAAPNTPPTAINFTAGALTAGALTAGQSVGNLTCTDLESATCTYVLSSQSTPGAFAVAANGAVTVANTALTAATYTVTVVATDAGGLTRTETKSITVSAAPVDNTEVVTLPTPTITATAITFSGGSVTDKDNPSGFSPTVSYIVKDTAGNTVSASSLTPNTTYTWQMQYTTYNGATNTLMTKTTSPQNFTTPALADTTAPQLTSSGTLPESNIGASVSHTLTFDEAINTVSVGTTPPGMTVTASKSGNTVTLTISTTAAFTAFGDVNIPLTITDSATPANSRTVNLTKRINDLAPIASSELPSVIIGDLGGNPITLTTGALNGVTDPLGRTLRVVAISGLPITDEYGNPTNFQYDSQGVITGMYDVGKLGQGTLPENQMGFVQSFPITITIQPVGSTQTLIRTQTIGFFNQG